MLRALLLGWIWLGLAAPAFCTEPNASPQDLMRELYRVHQDGEGPLLTPTAHAQRQIYFTKALADALDAELNRPNSDEVGNLDFDPFYNAQDFEIKDLDFAVAKVSGNATTAIARFKNFDQTVEIVYRLLQDADGWRIDDIEYAEGHTLRKILRGE